MSAKEETLKHIDRVRELLADVVARLEKRASCHDASKLESPEVETFEKYTHMLRGVTYGSEEYKRFLAEMKPALQHHYTHNSHHPEHFATGIRGMSLLDVIEMLVDWKAATERHADGDILTSVEKNQQRFGYTDELKQILLNTVREMGLAVSLSGDRP